MRNTVTPARAPSAITRSGVLVLSLAATGTFDAGCSRYDPQASPGPDAHELVGAPGGVGFAGSAGAPGTTSTSGTAGGATTLATGGIGGETGVTSTSTSLVVGGAGGADAGVTGLGGAGNTGMGGAGNTGMGGAGNTGMGGLGETGGAGLGGAGGVGDSTCSGGAGGGGGGGDCAEVKPCDKIKKQLDDNKGPPSAEDIRACLTSVDYKTIKYEDLIKLYYQMDCRNFAINGTTKSAQKASCDNPRIIVFCSGRGIGPRRGDWFSFSKDSNSIEYLECDSTKMGQGVTNDCFLSDDPHFTGYRIELGPPVKTTLGKDIANADEKCSTCHTEKDGKLALIKKDVIPIGGSNADCQWPAVGDCTDATKYAALSDIKKAYCIAVYRKDPTKTY